MIIVRTPLRISFLGGGTDYPAYFRQHGGATLVTTIDKYTYVTVRPLCRCFDHRIGIHDGRVEQLCTLAAIQYPAVRECLRFLDLQGGIAIQLTSDLPVGTGLGSSSAFTVGLLKALHAYKDELVTAEQVAREAVYIEQTLIQERVGCQDQYACAYGGLLHLQFGPAARVAVTPLALCDERSAALQQCLLLFYTGIQRSAHEILIEQMTRTQSNAIDAELAALTALVAQGIQTLTAATDLSRFGLLLHEGWLLKRRCSSQVSNAHIDAFYARARRAGATGGKLLGAGGGGFLLLWGEPSAQPAIRQALAELREVKFGFAPNGSEIMYQACVDNAN